MRAAEEICRRRPECHVIITGGDDVSYSARLPHGQSYRDKLLNEVQIDPQRVHLLGYVPYATHRKLLQISSAHVYLTVPFVLSWSLLEAMSMECVIIASNTAPVREVIRHNTNGLLVDFFSPVEIADRVDEVLDHAARMRHLGRQARADVSAAYDVTRTLPKYRQLFDERLIST
jgi:glycosyltransferase involved in cell wall biosynthesis